MPPAQAPESLHQVFNTFNIDNPFARHLVFLTSVSPTMATAYSPDKLEAILRQFIEGLKVDFATTINRAIDKAFDKSFHHPSQTSPPAPSPAPQPCAQTTTPELPPQPPTPVPAPASARSYPPSPSVETIEEVEEKQVYKPLRNIKQMRQKQKLNAAKKMLPTSEIPCFGKCFGWPPKSGGIYNCFSRDEEPDAWYATMLNATDALPYRT